MKPGKIYILRNPFHKDALVKIGRTSRISERRAREISAGTGVPADFEVLYEEDVFDCVTAEKAIHDDLHLYRVSKKREFFQLPLKVAVKTVFQTCLRINEGLENEVADRLILYLKDGASSRTLEKVKRVLERHPGKTAVYLVISTRNYKGVVIKVGRDLFVNLDAKIVNEIKRIKGLKEIQYLTKNIDRSLTEDSLTTLFEDVSWTD